jgi:Ser/Thr protein kinase RdoA (MazF antagonist)
MQKAYMNIGVAIAKLHKALATYAYEIPSWRMDLAGTVLKEAVPSIQRHLSGIQAAEFTNSLATLFSPLSAALVDLPEQYIHGDCHGGNILLYHGDVSGFVDVDHLPMGPRVYDIGYLLADFAKAQFFDIHVHARWLDMFDLVIAGYEQESALNVREKEAIVYVMLATQLIFTHWFFEHGMPEHAAKNLIAFYWIYERREEIQHRITHS